MAVSIYVFIGTKAQYIKTAPLLRLMRAREVDFELIDSGQHAAFALGLRRELDVKEPDVTLQSKGNIVSLREAAIWFIRHLALALFRPSVLRREIFKKGPGVCVIHGDTPSTLLALILAKRAGLQVAHIEAGLRSFNPLRPFPEEMIRIICMRFADLLFTPSDWAAENLRRMRVKGRVINVGQNTNLEAMLHALEANRGAHGFERPYCLMTMHRVETILNKRRLTFVVELAENLASRHHVVFVLHPPTRKRLEDLGLIDRILDHPRISATDLVEHGAFLNLLSDAEFVITDGGSIQEESFYLDVPCLVMRRETERMEGVGANVRLGDFDMDTVGEFLTDFRQLRSGAKVDNLRPSELILDSLLQS